METIFVHDLGDIEYSKFNEKYPILIGQNSILYKLQNSIAMVVRE